EFAQLLTDDSDVGCINVLQDSHSARLIELLKARGLSNLRCLPHPHAFTSEPGESLELLIRVLALGLHRNRRVLRHALNRSAQALAPHIDALLLGYGQCGGAVDDARSLLDLDIPLFQPMDGDRPMDDCVALCLGGRERYYDEQRKIAGTYFLTPGWSNHWRQMMDSHSGEVSQPGLKRLLADYERGLLLQSPALPNDELQQHGNEFSRMTGLRLETECGTMKPLTMAWDAAKTAVRSMSAEPASGGMG
ncbi:MAG: DUF1638 domain-containing protein, partial [Candidatus Thiodiazotropha sp. 6PLUC3]